MLDIILILSWCMILKVLWLLRQFFSGNTRLMIRKHSHWDPNKIELNGVKFESMTFVFWPQSFPFPETFYRFLFSCANIKTSICKTLLLKPNLIKEVLLHCHVNTYHELNKILIPPLHLKNTSIPRKELQL